MIRGLCLKKLPHTKLAPPAAVPRFVPIQKSVHVPFQSAATHAFKLNKIILHQSVVVRRFSTTDSSHADESKQLPKAQFARLVDEILEGFCLKSEETLEDALVQRGIDFDSTYSDGIWTLKLGHLGTYVLNKQTPNRQIWFSSPVSGPKRFNWDPNKKQWVNVRDGKELTSLLNEELSKLTGLPCSF